MDGAPNFAQSVPAGGYAWGYLDALSEDGRHGLTIIAFVGSVFSPYYHWSGRAEPENHVAINVALYGERGHRWSMTERGRGALDRRAPGIFRGPRSGRRAPLDCGEPSPGRSPWAGCAWACHLPGSRLHS